MATTTCYKASRCGPTTDPDVYVDKSETDAVLQGAVNNKIVLEDPNAPSGEQYKCYDPDLSQTYETEPDPRIVLNSTVTTCSACIESWES